MNYVVIKGRLTKDPETRQTTNGKTVCNVSVAVDRPRSKDDEVDFFNCTFWDKTAEFVSKYFHKGREILISGEMVSRNWTDKEGNKRLVWELVSNHVEFCGSKSQSDSSGNDAPAPAAKKPTKTKAKPTALDDDEFDDLADTEDKDLPF